MEIANYLRNCPPTKSQQKKLILDECETGKKQDVSHLKVFDNIIGVIFSKEKKYKSNIYKNKKEIFIDYSQDTTKYI